MVQTTERPGTRSQVRYVRMSASKARVVLDKIRNKHVAEAFTLLTYNERRASEVIQKCLQSAVANASHNDDIPPGELFVSACYADEGPTLKRFRPRARGRAGRIHKQTCHITIEVSRYSDDELDALRQRAENRGASRTKSDAAGDRRRRVAQSKGGSDADPIEDSPTEEVSETPQDQPTEASADVVEVAEVEAAGDPVDGTTPTVQGETDVNDEAKETD